MQGMQQCNAHRAGIVLNELRCQAPLILDILRPALPSTSPSEQQDVILRKHALTIGEVSEHELCCHLKGPGCLMVLPLILCLCT